MTNEERWERLIATVIEPSDATSVTADRAQRAFGSTSLKTNDRIFAMLVNDGLVVKLDRRRVDAMTASGAGERFDPGHGRLMKEWLAVHGGSDEDWLALAREAEAFVARRRPADD